LSLTDFQNFPGPVALFQDFPVLENATVKFQDFPGFPGPVRTLTLRNCLLLRPAYTFYITYICACLPCAVVKNGKIILFRQK